MCIFIFVCSIYSECAVAIYSECMDAYTEYFIHMPGVYVLSVYVDVYDKRAYLYASCECV